MSNVYSFPQEMRTYRKHHIDLILESHNVKKKNVITVSQKNVKPVKLLHTTIQISKHVTNDFNKERNPKPKDVNLVEYLVQ